jgi:hypothetical protein
MKMRNNNEMTALKLKKIASSIRDSDLKRL